MFEKILDESSAYYTGLGLNDSINFEEYDFMVINDDLNTSYQKIRSIIEAKRVARQNKNDIKKFINQFS